jgi:hypothetical protein
VGAPAGAVTVAQTFVLSALLVLGACTDGLRGVPMKAPAQTGKIVASASTSEPGGLLVFWHGDSLTHREVHKRGGGGFWIAGNEEELEAVWKAAASGPPPQVDFAKYVVLASLREGNYFLPKIIGLDAEASGLLTLRYAPETGMFSYEDLVVPIARIIGIPRRVLPATVVFLEGYAFEVPEIPFG